MCPEFSRGEQPVLPNSDQCVCGDFARDLGSCQTQSGGVHGQGTDSLISVAVQFEALRVPQLPPWVFFTRNGVSIVLAPLWMLALPFIGALGAWLSLRAGGNTRDRLLTALGSAWVNGAILTLGVPLSMIIERHFSLSIKLTAYIVYMIASCLVPAVLLALGALPWLGHNATVRADGATGL